MTNDPDNSDQTPASKAMRHHQMRHDWNNLIDDLIEEGQEQGAFDNLPGKGKPLNIKRNLYAPELELAHSLLQNNDIKPAWITARNDLLAQIEVLRTEMKRQWIQHERAYQQAQGEGHQGALVISWDDVCQRWQGEIADLNKQIESFNLKRPSDNLEMFKLDLEGELERVNARRWLRQF